MAYQIRHDPWLFCPTRSLTDHLELTYQRANCAARQSLSFPQWHLLRGTLKLLRGVRGRLSVLRALLQGEELLLQGRPPSLGCLRALLVSTYRCAPLHLQIGTCSLKVFSMSIYETSKGMSLLRARRRDTEGSRKSLTPGLHPQFYSSGFWRCLNIRALHIYSACCAIARATKQVAGYDATHQQYAWRT